MVIAFLNAGSAWGAVEVTVGRHEVVVGTTEVNIAVGITGGDALTDMASYVQSDGGGTLLGEPFDGPMITDVSYIGTIWESAPSGFTSFFGDLLTTPTAQVVDPQVSLNNHGETVSAEGTLFTISVDLTGFTASADIGNIYPVFLSNADFSTSTAFENAGNGITATLVDGEISVVSQSVGNKYTWIGDGSWHNSLNWSPAGPPPPTAAATLDNSFSASNVTSLVDTNANVDTIDVLGTAGHMILKVERNTTLTVTSGITVRPGAILKGHGTVAGDILNEGGTVTAGMPEPSTLLLALIGLTLLVYPRISSNSMWENCN